MSRSWCLGQRSRLAKHRNNLSHSKSFTYTLGPILCECDRLWFLRNSSHRIIWRICHRQYKTEDWRSVWWNRWTFYACKYLIDTWFSKENWKRYTFRLLYKCIAGLHDLEFQNSSDSVGANWHGFLDTESGVNSYFWCVGNTSSNTECSIRNWENVNIHTSVSRTLSKELPNGKIMFWSSL